MNYKEKFLTPYGLFNNLTFEEFCSKIPKIRFRREVPEDVLKDFEVIEKLMAFSYYEYRFSDEAFSKSLRTFEMAMKLRLKEFEPLSKKLMFDALIKKLTKLNLFDSDIQTLIDAKSLRNTFSHPENHGFAGTMYWHGIKKTSYLINEIFDNVSLRIKRRELINNFNERQQKASLGGYCAYVIGSKAALLYKMQLIFLNNKFEFPLYVLACTPLFDLESDSDLGGKVPYVFGLRVNCPVFDGNSLNAKILETGQSISFELIQKYSVLHTPFSNWKSEFEKKKYPEIYDLSLGHSYYDLLEQDLELFHKM